jgi:hypothetical protein
MMLLAGTTAILTPAVSLMMIPTEAVSLMMIPTEAVIAELQPLLCLDPLWN